MTDLEAAYFAAHKAYLDIAKEQSAERALLTREMELALHARFGERLVAANVAQEKAKAAMHAANIAAATAEHADKIGQEVFEWAREGGPLAPYYLSGRRARYEVWTPDSVSRGYAPAPGSLVLRILKKDGTLSQSIAHPDFRWLSDGKKP